ncbi:MAG TPA: hypothetical protein ENJ87_00480 [Gammaproteobacteria bacterium]|nr:hypothetical protein [Gammaproteobacteria bacterium]
MKPLQTRTIITIQQPRLWLLSLLGILCIIVLLVWFSFEYGRSVAGYNSSDSDAYIEQLQAQLEESQAEIIESNRRATMLERNSRIDDDASVQLKETLAQVQNEALELRKELSFYKSIVAPEQGNRSIAIQTIQIKQNEEGGYHYKIMVSQRGRNDRFARGTMDVSIEGVNKGQPVTLKLSEVSNDTKKPMKFGFKYFQNFEGVMTLPASFLPDVVRVKVTPKAGKIKAIDEQFAWSDLTAGGA